MNNSKFLGGSRKILDNAFPTESKNQAEKNGPFYEYPDKSKKSRIAYHSQYQNAQIPEQGHVYRPLT